MMNYHEPVMADEAIEYLNIKTDGIYADATFGGGGHSARILKQLGDKGRLISFDQDEDALQNVLETIAELRTGNEQVITVVGCGGNRDKAKRPLMASIACKLSDKVVFTSDNPRDEDPGEILKEMQTGVSPADYKKTVVLADREEAIKTACLIANDDDIILVAGKGHEKYQEIKGVKHDFDDKEVLGRMLNLFAN